MRYKKMCSRCGYEWQAWLEHPKECPRCHSYLDKAQKQYFCAECGRRHQLTSVIGKKHLEFRGVSEEMIDERRVNGEEVR